MSDELSPTGDRRWRRQAAIFAAIVSAFTGIGVALILFMTGKDIEAARKQATPTPTPARMSPSSAPR